MSNIAERIKQTMLRLDESIAVAESLTGGCLQATISSVSGSSKYFSGGITAYNIDHKVKLLGVDRPHAADVNCVSERVAREMALGVRQLFGCFVGVATTGYAEPCPDENVEFPFAYFAIDLDGEVSSGRIEAGDRTRMKVQQYVAETVLEILVDHLCDLKP